MLSIVSCDEAQPRVDAIVETLVYLYTESRRLTKELARDYGLTGPQLAVVKALEQLGDLSLSSLSARIKAQNSTVTGIIDRMEREELVKRERSARRTGGSFSSSLTDEGEKASATAIESRADGDLPTARSRVSLPNDDIEDLFRILGDRTEPRRERPWPLRSHGIAA